MARPRSAEYDDKRQQILDEAARLFAESGFPRTSIETLAKACGASKSWLYHYYPSKEAVLYDMLLQHVTLLLKTAREAEASAQSDEDRLRAVVRALMVLYVDARNKHVVLLNDLAVLPSEQQDALRGLQTELVDLVAELVRRLSPTVKRKRSLRKPVTMALMGMINFTYTWFRTDGPVKPEAFADIATDLFLGGIAAIDA